jgi:protein SCO1
VSHAARRGLLIFLAGLVVLLGALVVEYLYLNAPGAGLADISAPVGATIGGPFALTDQNGTPRRPEDFRGKLMLIYFGYTFCPDVCPTDLMAITQALDMLGPKAVAIQPIFISIDPERDSSVMGEYLRAFHPSFVGLTGTPEEIRKVANSYKAFYSRVEDARGGDYTIDHSGVIYLMGREGEYLGFMPPQTGPARLVEILRKYLD